MLISIHPKQNIRALARVAHNDNSVSAKSSKGRLHLPPMNGDDHINLNLEKNNESV